MKRLFLLAGFFTGAPMFIIISSLFLLFISQQKSGVLGLLRFSTSPIAYAALPSNLNLISTTVNQEDGRVEKVNSFFLSYNSPLAEYSGYIVKEADSYGIDYRYLPAIAMQESGGCLKEIPGTNNCWGYGITSKTTTSFPTYQDAIDRITRYFSELKNKGFGTLDAIGNIYNPSDHNNWKANVASFMSQL